MVVRGDCDCPLAARLRQRSSRRQQRDHSRQACSLDYTSNHSHSPFVKGLVRNRGSKRLAFSQNLPRLPKRRLHFETSSYSGSMVEERERIYYDDSIESVVRYRHDPPRSGLMRLGSDSTGWTPLYNSITGL